MVTRVDKIGRVLKISVSYRSQECVCLPSKVLHLQHHHYFHCLQILVGKSALQMSSKVCESLLLKSDSPCNIRSTLSHASSCTQGCGIAVAQQLFIYIQHMQHLEGNPHFFCTHFVTRSISHFQTLFMVWQCCNVEALFKGFLGFKLGLKVEGRPYSYL